VDWIIQKSNRKSKRLSPAIAIANVGSCFDKFFAIHMNNRKNLM